MYALYFVLFLAAFSAVSSQKCEKLKMYYEECNICHTCDPTRKISLCTRMACGPGLYDTKGSFLKALSKEFSNKCTAGEDFEIGCAKCTCSRYGRSANCIVDDCPSDNDVNFLALNVDTEVEQAAGKKCEPGTLFKSECNTCVCNDTGDSVTCTLMICPTDGYALNDGYEEEVFIGNSE